MDTVFIASNGLEFIAPRNPGEHPVLWLPSRVGKTTPDDILQAVKELHAAHPEYIKEN